MKGIIASPGIAIGKAFVLEQKEVVINEALLANPSECEAEIEKFRKAVTETEAQLNEIIEKTEKRLSAKEADVFRAHLMMLNDPTLEDAVMDKINNGMMHADKAVAEACLLYTSAFFLYPAQALLGFSARRSAPFGSAP